MVKKLLLLFFTFSFSYFTCINSVKAQNPDIKRTWHWYFGDSAGIDFSSGVPKADTNGNMYAPESGSSISDTNGNLVFYTNGTIVYNHLHKIIDTGLDGEGTPYQSSIIVPEPGNDSIFFIFTNDGEDAPDTTLGLRYSVVNMKANSGLGAVIKKNILLFTPSPDVYFHGSF